MNGSGELLRILIYTAAILGGVQAAVAYGVFFERRALGRFQNRIGPNRVGFGLLATLPVVGGAFGFLRDRPVQGLGQPMADGIKLLLKEDFIPAGVDRPTYCLAPYIGLVTGFLGFAVIPFAPGIVFADLSIGVLYLLAMGSLASYGVVLAGWSSDSKYALLGGLRATAQLLSYEIPYGVALLHTALLAESLSLVRIVEAQTDAWFALQAPVAFGIALIGALAETNRAPFDMPEAEAELVAGYHTEYSGMRFALFFLAEYAHIFLASSVLATLFLGGWRIPFVSDPGPVLGLLAFFAKVLVLFFWFVWVRATWPRLRYDTLMRFGWRVLLPLAFASFCATAVWKVVA